MKMDKGNRLFLYRCGILTAGILLHPVSQMRGNRQEDCIVTEARRGLHFISMGWSKTAGLICTFHSVCFSNPQNKNDTKNLDFTAFLEFKQCNTT